MDIASPRTTRPAEVAQAAETGELARQWDAVQQAAAAVALLAGLAAEKPDPRIRHLPAQIRNTGGWRLELARNQIADMAAMMRPGLAALLAVDARGQDATAAAVALWREYHAAREAVLGLVPQTGAMGPRRST